MSSKFIPLFLKKPIAWLLALIAVFLLSFFYFFVYTPKESQRASVLWHIVAYRCAKNPEHKPCLAYNQRKDYVLLKDLVGKAQVLLIPLHRLHGVESPALGELKTPNYLESAWEVRGVLSHVLHHPITDDEISLSINSRLARSQDQLHIHISCLKKPVARELHTLNPEHLPETIILEGNPYKIHLTASLKESPFIDLNREENFDPHKMGRKTIVVAAAPERRFYILTSEADLFHLNWGSGESLQEHNCEDY